MKTVIVTGASKGIGKEIASHLDKLNYKLILIARNTDLLHQLAKTMNNSPVVLPFDLAKPSLLEELVPEITKHKNNLCGLINNAGIFIKKPFTDHSINDWEQLFKINLLAPAELSKLIIPLLKQSSQTHKFIINISSSAAQRPIPETGSYSALKAALDHLSRIMALELAPSHICVNTISPGIVDTPLHSFEKLTENEYKGIEALHPVGRMGQPKDIASMVAFLANENNNWVTGSNFIVDGGLSLK